MTEKADEPRTAPETAPSAPIASAAAWQNCVKILDSEAAPNVGVNHPCPLTFPGIGHKARGLR